eukprot:NODE_1034_length_1697_cov_14.217197_g971_i0.p1 GENE.NODE_1034_length_1697_cov_14.217197_g971_i0~~NODE_1034_length_1697_cov_14.217197_g971_i0.p1  ORF type:complete len:504 (+),score=114.48 NODE_1034_length_1697_cov_14.217197_g971_i0:76-1587(+)
MVFVSCRPLCTMGVSGMAVYVPKLRVQLKDWCEWTGHSWAKTQHVTGHSFRLPAQHENIYTMAANAVLRLILQNGIAPNEIGFLGFGTESSTDNSAGSVIIRGMVNHALPMYNLPRLPRSLEVPEFKHACLGGVYALKAACRFVGTDPRQRKAIVVCGDIAEYQRGSTGEQTQGAGSCAMFVECDPKLFEVRLHQAGSSSAYRGPDFRKPFSRHFAPTHAPHTLRLNDFPVFTGAYSQTAYLDATSHAVEDMLSQLPQPLTQGRYFRDHVCSLFFHRPFHHMPTQALAFMYVRGMAHGTHHHSQLRELCSHAEVSYNTLLQECHADVHLYSSLLKSHDPVDPFPATRACSRELSKTVAFKALVDQKMSLGSPTMLQLGNLYSAALPTWVAAAFAEAAAEECTEVSAGQAMVMIGYGSGDAAEAIPISPVMGWQGAAAHIQLSAVLAEGIDLTQHQYEAIHDGHLEPNPYPPYTPHSEFVIATVGERYETHFQDLGVEYYDYVL